VLLYVANWPKPRVNAWDILLKARAVENMCYTIGVNRIGKDHNRHEYVGHTQVIDFMGEYVLEPQEADAVFIVELDKVKLLETRKKLAFLKDKDDFEIQNT
jgi:predicted amidohydrolase